MDKCVGSPVLKLFSEDGGVVNLFFTVQHWCVSLTNSGVDKALVLSPVPLFNTKYTAKKLFVNFIQSKACSVHLQTLAQSCFTSAPATSMCNCSDIMAF